MWKHKYLWKFKIRLLKKKYFLIPIKMRQNIFSVKNHYKRIVTWLCYPKSTRAFMAHPLYKLQNSKGRASIHFEPSTWLDVVKEEKDLEREALSVITKSCVITSKNSPSPLKVSKSRKQNTKFAHTPKNQQNFVHFFALISKSGWIKKTKPLYCFK